TSQYPFLSGVEPRLICPSGQRGVGSGGGLSAVAAAVAPRCPRCAKPVMLVKPINAVTTAAVFSMFQYICGPPGALPHRQLLAIGKDHESRLLGSGRIASVFCQSGGLHRDFIPDLD